MACYTVLEEQMKKHSLIHAGVAEHNPHQYNVIIGTELGQFSNNTLFPRRKSI